MASYLAIPPLLTFFLVPPIAPKTIYWASQDQSMSFLKCFPMALETLHGLKMIKYKIFSTLVSPMSLTYFLEPLTSSKIISNTLNIPWCPQLLYIYIYIVQPNAYFKCAFSIALVLLIPISPFIISVPHHLSSSLVLSKCVFVIDQT